MNDKYFDIFSLSKRKNSATTFPMLIIIITLLLFYKLSDSEVQPWDEGLYAVRAYSIVAGGNPCDQTDASLGGLYSSTYPPLTVWAIAGFMQLLGPTAFALRLFSAICSGMTLIFIWLLARRFLDEENSVLSVLVLFGSSAWIAGSTQGMTDVPLLMFLAASLYGISYAESADDFPGILKGSALYGLAFACALMTKIVISFLPLLFLAVFIAEKKGRIKNTALITSGIIAVLLALPWHISMIIAHGKEFAGAFLVPHIYSAVENNSKASGIFYYANRLIISHPIEFVALIALLLIALRHKKIKSRFDASEWFILKNLILWFGIGFTVFSLSAAKLPHYALYLLVPGSLIALTVLSKAKPFRTSRGEILCAIGLSIASLWSFAAGINPAIRKTLLSSYYFLPAGLLVAAAIVFAVLLYAGKLNSLLPQSSGIIRTMTIFTVVLCLARAVLYLTVAPPVLIEGARETGAKLLYGKVKEFAYVYHEHNPADSLNPQLNWYTALKYMPGHGERSYHPVRLKEGTASYKELAGADTLGKMPLVYYFSADQDAAARVIDELSALRPIISITRNYALFGTMYGKRPPVKTI